MRWKDIPGFPGYQVSDTGLIKSCARLAKGRWGTQRIKERIIKHWTTKVGYCIIGLERDNKRVRKLLHRLVAQAFVPNPNNLPTVNHKDGNKSNCAADNLEWLTMGDNSRHAYRLGLKCADGSRNGRSKLTETIVQSIRQDRRSGMSADAIACKYNICKASVYSICSKRSWKHV